MDEIKDKVKKECSTPKMISEIGSFHGFASFYRRFVKDFCTIVTLLTEIVKKTIYFKWKIKKEKAFNLLKENFISAPLLVLPNFTKILKLNVMI
jgi:hypothetical protein